MTGHLLVSVVLLVPVLAWAGDPPVSYVVENAVAAKPQTNQTSRKLPYGVDDVVKLSKARISEDIILNFIQTSGTLYTLEPQDIVALKEQGVSDRVVNAMIDQRKSVPASAVNVAQTAASSQQQANPTPVNVNVSVPQSTRPVYTPVYVNSEPASTVHVIPYPAARAAYYGPPPYWPRPNHGYGYYPYYGYGFSYARPSFSIGFGFGYGGYSHYGGYRHCW